MAFIFFSFLKNMTIGPTLVPASPSVNPQGPALAVSKRFPFAPSHSAHNGLESYFRLSRVFSRSAASLFQNPADAFRHTYQCIGILREHARATIGNRQLWGLLWGPLIHLGASRHISNQLATTTELVEPERVAGFSVFRSAS